ncbi:unnamed protein product [Rotaria sp. Silwood2]|nr:unnamed protein product [Rotaria sp. Silwood2]
MSTEERGLPAVVIDNGSFTCKAGFAGEDHWRHNIPWVPRSHSLTHSEQLFASIQNGIITDWDGIEAMWSHIFQELTIDPQQYPMLLTEKPLNPRGCREKTTHIMFEKFEIPSLYLTNQSTLSLYASGRTTGIGIDLGDTVMHTVPIYEGYSIPHTVHFLDIDLTDFLMRLLTEGYYSFTRRNCERQIFPRSNHIGCYFHFTQSIYRQIQQLGLSSAYCNDDGIRMTCRKLMALALLPPPLVLKSFEDLHESVLLASSSSSVLHSLKPLFDYFEHYWINTVDFKKMECLWYSY